MDARVEAIRNDPSIGEGSCSSVDECMTDAELIDELNREGITDPKDAVTHFRASEGLRNEIEDDVRGAGNVSPLHHEREAGRGYDDDREDFGSDLGIGPSDPYEPPEWD
jgi:hypothetical protein